MVLLLQHTAEGMYRSQYLEWWQILHSRERWINRQRPNLDSAEIVQRKTDKVLDTSLHHTHHYMIGRVGMDLHHHHRPHHGGHHHCHGRRRRHPHHHRRRSKSKIAISAYSDETGFLVSFFLFSGHDYCLCSC